MACELLCVNDVLCQAVLLVGILRRKRCRLQAGMVGLIDVGFRVKILGFMAKARGKCEQHKPHGVGTTADNKTGVYLVVEKILASRMDSNGGPGLNVQSLLSCM